MTTIDTYGGAATTLHTGRWYAAAIDTGPIPASLALDTIEERLRADLHVASIRLYQSRDDVPATVPATVRDAPGADVWATGQYLGGDASAPLPDGVIAVAEMPAPGSLPTPPRPRPPGPPAPPGPRPHPTPGPTPPPPPKLGSVSTPVLVAVGVGTVVVVGGGIALWAYLSKRRTNPRRRRRRRR